MRTGHDNDSITSYEPVDLASLFIAAIPPSKLSVLRPRIAVSTQSGAREGFFAVGAGKKGTDKYGRIHDSERQVVRATCDVDYVFRSI